MKISDSRKARTRFFADLLVTHLEIQGLDTICMQYERTCTCISVYVNAQYTYMHTHTRACFFVRELLFLPVISCLFFHYLHFLYLEISPSIFSGSDYPFGEV